MKEKIRKTLRILIIAFGAITLLLPVFLMNDTDLPVWLAAWGGLGLIIWTLAGVALAFVIVVIIIAVVSEVINWVFGYESIIDDWFD